MTREGSARVVLHRKPHPRDTSRRWFTYKDRDYAVNYEGPGWGYSISSIPDYHDVATGLFTLDEVRREAIAYVEAWLDERDEIEYMRTHDGERRPGTRPEYGTPSSDGTEVEVPARR